MNVNVHVERGFDINRMSKILQGQSMTVDEVLPLLHIICGKIHKSKIPLIKQIKGIVDIVEDVPF